MRLVDHAWRQGCRHVGLISAFVILILLAFLFRSMVVDDAYISLRYADNLISGKGLVFNPGETVEGVTNIGWTLFLVPFIVFLGSISALKIVGFLLTLATVFMFYRICPSDDDGVTCRHAGFAACMLVTQLDFTLFSLNGMETPLLSFLLCWLVWMVQNKQPMRWIALVSSCLFLVHPEAILYYPLARLIILLRSASGRRIINADLIYLISIAGFSIARLHYYGSLVPNTAFAKEPSIKIVLLNLYHAATGGSGLFPSLFSSVFFLIILIVGIMKIGRKDIFTAAFVMSGILVGYGFSIYAPADWTGLARYFAPYMPLVLIAFWRGISEIIRSSGLAIPWIRRKAEILVVSLSLAIILPSISRIAFHLQPANLEQYPGYVLTSRELVKPAKWIRWHVAPDSVIACRRIGALGFYSKMNVFDYLFGLTDPAIAKAKGSTPALVRDPVIGEIWKRKNPNYYLEDRDRIELLLGMTGGTLRSFFIQGGEYSLIKSFIIGRYPNGKKVEWCLCERRTDRSTPN